MQTDIKLNLITAAALISIGTLCAIAADSHITSLQRDNYDLIDINASLIKENDNMRYCAPKIGGRAVISYINGRLFCEVHNVESKH